METLRLVAAGRTKGPVVAKTYEFDSKKPKLPLPLLNETFARLRESILGLPDVSSEALGAFDRAVAESLPQLEDAQELLRQRHSTLPHYVGEWWDQYAYLASRYPNVIATNVFGIRNADLDPTTEEPKPPVSNPHHRAALLALEGTTMLNLLKNERLPPETFGRATEPLCMEQYRRYFSVRIPGHGMDTLHVSPPEDIKHYHVMVDGGSFLMKIGDGATGGDFNFAEYCQLIEEGVRQVRAAGIPNVDECVGALTCADRESWATARDLLMATSEQNRQNFNNINVAHSVICIDESEPPITKYKDLAFSASHGNPKNRWFDRSCIKIVASNGVVMDNGDHTAMDAVVMATIPYEIVAVASLKLVQSGALRRVNVRAAFDPSKYVQVMRWDIPDAVKPMIVRAIEEHTKLTQGPAKSDVDIFRFKHYGKDYLRSVGANADAVVQQAIQLAFFKDRHRIAPVYESASTRAFRFGRTETIRSLTPQQREFVLRAGSQGNPGRTSPQESALQLKLLKAALKKHADISLMAAGGQGTDRHLFALRLAQGQLRKALPSVFDDPLFKTSGSYELLTSQMMGNMFVGGFAHVLPDGYGCCYYLRKDQIWIVVANSTSGGLTDLDRFQKHLTDAFLHIRDLLVNAPETSSNAKSKL